MLKSFSGSKSFRKNPNTPGTESGEPSTASGSDTRSSDSRTNPPRQHSTGVRTPHSTHTTQGGRSPAKVQTPQGGRAPEKMQTPQGSRAPNKGQDSRITRAPQNTPPNSQINRPQQNINNNNIISRSGVASPDNTINKANLNNPNNKAHHAANLFKNIIKDGITQTIKPKHSANQKGSSTTNSKGISSQNFSQNLSPGSIPNQNVTGKSHAKNAPTQNISSNTSFNNSTDHKFNKTKDPKSSVPTLKVIPLGGMREIGKNMFVYEYGDDIIIVDCGIGFPEENMPGIDVVIPDMSYVFQNKARVRGIFFTHGHEDHIGAVAWLTNEVRAPIYGSKLTISLIAIKLEDRGGAIKNVDLHPIEDGDVIKSGCFSVEFIHTNHSIADANMLAIKTPVGSVIHTGDFKIDYTPINGDPIDLSRIATIGHEKPLLMLCESTNIEKSGFSMSESKVGESFINIFDKAPGRVIVATFSSNIYRMQQIFTAAEYYNRKVCLIGRSIINVFNAANSLGYMKIKPETLIDINKVKNIPPENLVIISTGSQGETLSALTRMAFNEHQKIEISSGDTIIISASPIPGNEKPIYRVINELYLRGANVIYSALAEVHASGHAYQEELKLIHQLVKPKYFVPVHGEYRMLFQHSALAHNMGLPQDNSFLLSNGDILELTANSAKVTGYVPADGILIDGYGFGDIGNTVLSDRKLLSDDGVLSVAIAVSGQTGTLLGEPHIETRGFIYEAEEEEITKEIKNKVFVFVNKCSAANKPLMPMLKSTALRDQLRDFLFDRTKRRPIIIISAIEV